MDTLATRAARARKERDYSEAEKLYTKLINISLAHPEIALFDARAACYEELDRLEDALRDGKRMLQLGPRDARIKGYLRAGKVYQLQGKDASALKCYERGCTSVTANDKLFPILRKLKTSLEKRLITKTPRKDPFSVLPLEIIWEILAHMSFVQRLTLLAVSKHWNQILSSNPRFFAHLDLITHARRKPKASSVESYIKRSKGQLILLSTNVILKADSLRFHCTFCRGLTTIQIPLIRDLTTILPRAKNLRVVSIADSDSLVPNMSLDETLRLLHALKSVRSYSARISSSRTNSEQDRTPPTPESNLDTLKTLALRTDVSIRTEDIFRHNTRPLLCNLNELRLEFLTESAVLVTSSEIAWPEGLSTLQAKFDPKNLQDLPGFPSSLSFLDLDCQGQTWSQIPATLQELSLTRYAGGIDLTQWRCVAENIEVLRLSAARIDSAALQELLSECRSLRVVELTSHTGDSITDEHLKIISDQNVSLQVLILTRQRSFSGSALVNSTKKLSKLQMLGVDECDQIGKDVVRWIRSKGVLVRHNLSGRA